MPRDHRDVTGFRPASRAGACRPLPPEGTVIDEETGTTVSRITVGPPDNSVSPHHWAWKVLLVARSEYWPFAKSRIS